jgi:hypothetical protein
MQPPSLSLMGCLMLSILTPLPAWAHKTEVSGNVAGTWHLEPNHSAKAGEPAKVWVALTQQGGRVIPLEQCDCNLTVYDANQAGAPPIMQPTLAAMSPESFENIPGTEITFPEVGEYRFVLTGSPKADATFTPFELSYTAVVAAGSASASPPPPQSEANQSNSDPIPTSSDSLAAPVSSAAQNRFWGIAIAMGVVGIAIAAAFLLRKPKPNRPQDDGVEH